MSWQQEYLNRFYNRSKGWVDGTTAFHQICSGAISPGSNILEIGAGPTNPTSAFLATLGKLHGVNIDPAASANRHLISSAVIERDHYPFESATFDACVSNYVLEHVEHPDQHLAEVRRVLKLGGVYVFRTPNRFHYVSLIASLTPHWFHELAANRVRGLPLDAHEPYPTFHALNDAESIRVEAQRAGLYVEELQLIEKEPSYGMSSRILFFPLMAYERIVNFTPKLAVLRANIFAVLRAK